MFIGVDSEGVVRLHGRDQAGIPEGLTAIELTREQAEAYAALPMPVEKVLFVDGEFSTVPVPEKAVALDTISRIEAEHPITHRALREGQIATIEVLRWLRAKINALDAEVAGIASRTAQPLPEIPVSHLEQVMKAVDAAIRAERAKL